MEKQGSSAVAKNKLIVHGLMQLDNQYLVIKRSEIKRGKPNSLPRQWDIPGGMVEPTETPRQALVREAKEEVNLNVSVGSIVHEDSNYDEGKNTVFTRLVYICQVLDIDLSEMKLDPEEHTDYRLINGLSDMEGEKVVDYLDDVFANEKNLKKVR